MLPIGCKSIDDLLGGGLSEKVITQVYGPAGSGKTNICLYALYTAAKAGKKVLFIDSEGSFSEKRFKQITGRDSETVLENTLLKDVMDFKDQGKVIRDLPPDVDLVIVDSMTALYRLEMDEEKYQETNRELGKQLALLLAFARKSNVPILVTNQVYSDLDGKVEPVGGDVLKYSTKVVIELSKNGYNSRKAVLKKHLFKEDGKESSFLIIEKGLADDS